MKLIDARRDLYRRLAHKEGYRSRAAYKLKELNVSYRIIGPGFYVLDLGCSPGGWTQVAQEIAGNKGMVMGIDKSYVEEIPNVHIIRGDIEDESIVESIFDYFGTKVNAIICDLSPQISGTWEIDHGRQISLNYAASKIMDHVLARKGNALFKVFDGQYSIEFRDYIKKKFARVQLRKPKASRKTSSELYYVCLGYLGS